MNGIQRANPFEKKVGFSGASPFVDLPLGRPSRAAYLPVRERLFGALFFLLAVGGTPVTSQSLLTQHPPTVGLQ
jgi:hypothetical protein